MQEIISQIKKEIKKDILPKYPFIKKYKIKNFEEDDNYYYQEYLGLYENGSVFTGKVIIKLNIPCIKNSLKDYQLPLYDVIYTTILHELAHAIQDYKGKFFNEKRAEDFAYNYYNFGKILKI